MVKQIVLLSGPVSSGKTTLSSLLVKRFNAVIFKTGNYLKSSNPKIEHGRESMQILGEKMDRKTKGGWVCKGLTEFINKVERDHEILVVDSVRILNQIGEIRKAYGKVVTHIHLDAPLYILKERYQKRNSSTFKELPSYELVLKNRTESKVSSLAEDADVVIDTKRSTEEDVMVRAASYLGLYGKEYLRLVDVLVGGQYGSEGKGNIVNYLAREYDVLIRVGGPNAGHKVYFEPEPYTFHQLPSGTLSAPVSKLLIGPGATIYLPVLFKEIAECSISSDRLSIDPQAMIINDEDRENEKILKRLMGSTGQGVGSATARRIFCRLPRKVRITKYNKGLAPFLKQVKLAKNIPELKPFVRESCQILEDAFKQRKKIFLEGTQGTCLSLYHGFYPFVTSRDTSVAGCLAESGISANRIRKIVMVCRTYPIRVQSPKNGDSGPLFREIDWDEVEKRSNNPPGSIQSKEITSTTQRNRRVGEFEWVTFRKAASLNAPTDIALTFVDYIDKRNSSAMRFDQLTPETIRFIEEIEKVSSAPVSLISTRFGHRNIIDRRSW